MNAVTYTYSARPNRSARDRQRAECEALAHKLGHEVTHTYDDQDGDRSALTRLLADAAAGTVTVLLVSNLYRLGRTVNTLPHHIDAFHKAGVTIYEVTEGTPSGMNPGMFSLLRALADLEEEFRESYPR